MPFHTNSPFDHRASCACNPQPTATSKCSFPSTRTCPPTGDPRLEVPSPGPPDFNKQAQHRPALPDNLQDSLHLNFKRPSANRLLPSRFGFRVPLDVYSLRPAACANCTRPLHTDRASLPAPPIVPSLTHLPLIHISCPAPCAFLNVALLLPYPACPSGICSHFWKTRGSCAPPSPVTEDPGQTHAMMHLPDELIGIQEPGR